MGTEVSRGMFFVCSFCRRPSGVAQATCRITKSTANTAQRTQHSADASAKNSVCARGSCAWDCVCEGRHTRTQARKTHPARDVLGVNPARQVLARIVLLTCAAVPILCKQRSRTLSLCLSWTVPGTGWPCCCAVHGSLAQDADLGCHLACLGGCLPIALSPTEAPLMHWR